MRVGSAIVVVVETGTIDTVVGGDGLVTVVVGVVGDGTAIAAGRMPGPAQELSATPNAMIQAARRLIRRVYEANTLSGSKVARLAALVVPFEVLILGGFGGSPMRLPVGTGRFEISAADGRAGLPLKKK